MKLTVYFENLQDKMPITYKLKMLVRRAIESTLGYEGQNGEFELSVTFTDNEGIRELNNKYRNIDRATDVLSFPLFEDGECDENFEGMLGDIVISLERAMEQAEEFGHSYERETAFLCAHSMLHLLGYDHEKGEAEDADMRRRQDSIMKIMGLEIK